MAPFPVSRRPIWANTGPDDDRGGLDDRRAARAAASGSAPTQVRAGTHAVGCPAGEKRPATPDVRCTKAGPRPRNKQAARGLATGGTTAGARLGRSPSDPCPREAVVGGMVGAAHRPLRRHGCSDRRRKLKNLFPYA